MEDTDRNLAGAPLANPLKGDPFRREFGKLEMKQTRYVQEVKALYEEVWTKLRTIENEYGPSRDLSIARTELQTSSMWAIRAVTRTGTQE